MLIEFVEDKKLKDKEWRRWQDIVLNEIMDNIALSLYDQSYLQLTHLNSFKCLYINNNSNTTSD